MLQIAKSHIGVITLMEQGFWLLSLAKLMRIHASIDFMLTIHYSMSCWCGDRDSRTESPNPKP